jgi:hypothetical protein
LASACRGMTCCAIPAPPMGHDHQWQGKDVVQRTQKEQMGKWHQAKPECLSGIKDQDLEEQLCLRKEWTCGRIFRKTINMEITKQLVRSFIRLQKRNVRTLWMGRPPPKRKKKLHAE